MTAGSQRKVTGIPNFAPELIRRVRLPDAMRAKQLAKALSDLGEEGVAQVFRPSLGSDWLVGVVGPLQLDVLSSRLDTEYGVPVRFEDAGFQAARWIGSKSDIELKRFLGAQKSALATDAAGSPVYLVRDQWSFGTLRKDWPQIDFATTRERA